MKLVVIPIYNEAPTVDGVLRKIRDYHDGDILALDDGSTDDSPKILEKFNGLKTIRHNVNMGYGQSLIDGMKYAVDNGYEYVITIDCDEQHEPCMIPKMFENIGDYDVLSGSRYLCDNENDDAPPKERRNVNMAITEMINDITGFNLTDSFCGFKVYRVSSIANLKLSEPGYAMPLQFWVQAKHCGLRVKEISVPRIYKNLHRTFGSELDDPDLRLNYYMRVIDKELKRWSISSLSELTRTI